MALGKNIEHLRKLAGLTRQAVAKGIGVDGDQAIYALESRDSARSEFAPALAKFFSVDLETLITEDLTALPAEEIRKLSVPSNKDQRGRGGVSAANSDESAEDIIRAFGEQASELIRLFGIASPTGRRAILTAARNAAESNGQLVSPAANNL